MIDSTNVRVLADNISKLWDKIKSISGDLLPSRSTATTGQILKLTGENKTPAWTDEYSYTPPAYSTTETATGQKWIDGKDIYSLTISEAMGSATTGQEVIKNITTNLNVISMSGHFIDSVYSVIRFLYNYYYDPVTGNITIAKTSNMVETNCTIILYYTKPNPVPGDAKGPEDTDQEPEIEPEEKKTTKKKSSK